MNAPFFMPPSNLTGEKDMKNKLFTFVIVLGLLVTGLAWAAGNIFVVKMDIAGDSTTVDAGETGYYPVLNLNNAAGHGPVDINNVSFMMDTLSNTASGSTINFAYRQSSAADASDPEASCWNIAKQVAIVFNCDTVSGNTEGYIYPLDLEPATYIRFEVTTGTTDVAPKIAVTFIGTRAR